jgi:hypothetical protein
MNIRAALRVLLHGLPKPEIIHTTNDVLVYIDAPLTAVYQASKNTACYEAYPPWHNAIFRSCKEAFAVTGGEGTVTAMNVCLTADGRMYQPPSKFYYEFYKPPTNIGDAQVEGNEASV